MNDKGQILLTAFDLFSQYGIKKVSMDDIARSLRISKRTLYEFLQIRRLCWCREYGIIVTVWWKCWKILRKALIRHWM